MNFECQQIIVVNSQDISCGKCHLEYTSITNEPMTLDCECTLCFSCEEELKDPKHCPLCKKELLRPPKINKLFSQLLKSNSQASKCPTHQLPCFFKKEGKLHCSQCSLDAQEVVLIPKEQILSRLEELKNSGEKEERKIQKALRNKTDKYNSNFKRQLDDLDEETYAYIRGNTKKLKIERDMEIFTAFDREKHQLLAPLLKFQANIKMLKDGWERNENLETAVQILKTPLATEQDLQFSLETVEKIDQRIKEKNEKRESEIIESKKRSLEEFKRFVRQSWSLPSFNQKMRGPEADYYLEKTRETLLETFEEYGFFVADQGKDYIELQEHISNPTLSKFYPEFFLCSINKLNLSCVSVPGPKFMILCEILQNIQNLSELTLSFDHDRYSPEIIGSILSLLHHSKALQNFSCKISTNSQSTPYLEDFIKGLFNSKRISSLTIKHSLFHISVDLRQDQLQSPEQEASMMEKPCHLQELNLEFVKTDLLEDELSQIIPEFIKSSNQLKKVSLLLAGKKLLENNILNDLFSLSDQIAFCQHCLEKFSLTLLLFSEIGIEMIIDYLNQFPQLKAVELIVNLVNTSPRELIESFSRIMQKEHLPLFSLDLKCRLSDFNRLTPDDKKVLKVCQDHANEQKIPFHLVFEELRSVDLPDYVDKTFLSSKYQRRSEEKKSQGNQGDVLSIEPENKQKEGVEEAELQQ